MEENIYKDQDGENNFFYPQKNLSHFFQMDNIQMYLNKFQEELLLIFSIIINN